MFTGGKVVFESVFWFGVCGLVVCSGEEVGEF